MDEWHREGGTVDQTAGYRALVARANYLGSDWPDLRSVEELCGGMSTPTKADMRKLRRLTRYLVGRPRVVLELQFQGSCEDLSGCSDSDWVECLRTARSISGRVILKGITFKQELGGDAE